MPPWRHSRAPAHPGGSHGLRAASAVLLALVTVVTTLSIAAPVPASTTPDPEAPSGHLVHPVVIAHRGASGYRPEHTLAAYELAIRQGADLVEPDLVSTQDGVLVARHENEISGTTDVANHPELAGRKATKTVDGVEITGWFTEDLTLAELKTLRAKERIPAVRPANTVYDGRFEVPTFQEVIDLAARWTRRTGRTIGIYPETKHPTYFDSVGLSLEEPLVRTLRRNGLDRHDAPVFVQSFEVGNLRRLARMTRAPIVQLLGAAGAPYDLVAVGDPRTYADLATARGLTGIARYADGVGVSKNLVLTRATDGSLAVPTGLVHDAHRQGLLVHSWTFRRENTFLPTDFQVGDFQVGDFQVGTDPVGTDPVAVGDLAGEVALFLRLGVDGVFTDNPDVAVAARDAVAQRESSFSERARSGGALGRQAS